MEGSNPRISLDGRYVVFESQGNVIPGLTATHGQCYVRDLLLETTEMVSVSTTEVPSAQICRSPSISADGQYVAFQTTARNLDDGPPQCTTNCDSHIYIRNRIAGITLFVSRRSNGHPFSQSSTDPEIVPENEEVLFTSTAYSGATGAPLSVFSHVWPSSTTRNVTSGGVEEYDNPVRRGENPSASANGSRVAVESTGPTGGAPRARRVFLISRTDPPDDQFAPVRTYSGSRFPSGESWDPAIAPGGYRVAFTSNAVNFVQNDTNGADDVFLYNHVRFLGGGLDSTQRVSVSSDGTEANGDSGSATVSDEFRVAFKSNATNLVVNDTNGNQDIFFRNVFVGETQLISRSPCAESDGDSSDPSISSAGTEIAFASDATNLIDGVRILPRETRVYVYRERRFVSPFTWISQNLIEVCPHPGQVLIPD